MCSAGNLAGFLTDQFSVFHSLSLAVVIRILTCALRQKKMTFSKWKLGKSHSQTGSLFVCIHSFIHSDLTKRKPQSIPVNSFWTVRFLIWGLKKSLLLTKPAFIWSKIQQKQYSILNNCFLFKYIFKCNLFLWSKLNVQHHYSSLQCHVILQKSF